MLADAFQNKLLHEAVNVFGLNVQDSEELVSDVLVSVVTKIHSFEFKRHDSDFNGWVIRIFRNRVRDYVRQRAAAAESFVEFIDDPLTNGEGCSPQEKELANYIVRQYEHANRDAVDGCNGGISSKLMAIADALDRLESWERVLLRCRALDISYEEIAGYTRKPVAHLKVYHARVKKKFIKLLAEYYPELEHHET
ncbi:MAG: sigma-70 family RNA polymerase sigma factor [Bacteroidetes bacterium]|nr:sigma-70 family RNA polymerase sigma factor [Bacteroidota bacterium]MCW5894425.1 sigma-70 family RNA polymerase sigma factor [Bacteroidota bacterium]